MQDFIAPLLYRSTVSYTVH